MTARRPRARRQEVVVFTEGMATEPSYIDAIKRMQTAFVVRVDDRHGTPGQLVPIAMAELERLTQESRHEGTTDAERPLVWCVVDRDQHENVDALIARATAAGVRVAFSHPCIELWLLLHFEWHGQQEAGSCRRVTRAVESHISGYRQRGKRVRLEDVSGRYAQARGHAQRLNEQHRRDKLEVPTQRDPSTNIWELADSLGISY
ncbi:MAG TPA: RloB family protein [Micromonosporaceae bacterium]|jgi:hypothetical protein